MSERYQITIGAEGLSAEECEMLRESVAVCAAQLGERVEITEGVGAGPAIASVARMPLRWNVWVGLAYVGVVLWLGMLAGGVQGVLCAVLIAGFSFQFWTYACWRGITRAAEQAVR